MSRLPAAPSLSGVKLMGEMGFGRPMTSKEIDAKLAKEGSWVASENERRKIKQMVQDPAGIDPVVIKAPPDERKLREHIAKAQQKIRQKERP